jgi:hypothetical protein
MRGDTFAARSSRETFAVRSSTAMEVASAVAERIDADVKAYLYGGPASSLASVALGELLRAIGLNADVRQSMRGRGLYPEFKARAALFRMGWRLSRESGLARSSRTYARPDCDDMASHHPSLMAAIMHGLETCLATPDLCSRRDLTLSAVMHALQLGRDAQADIYVSIALYRLGWRCSADDPNRRVWRRPPASAQCVARASNSSTHHDAGAPPARTAMTARSDQRACGGTEKVGAVTPGCAV